MKTRKKPVVSIDGNSSTGKSSLAKQLAKAFGYIHIDSGAMYRAVTYFALEKKLIQNKTIEEQKLLKQLDKIVIEFILNPKNENEIYLNGICVESEIRSMEVNKHVSLVAKIPAVRNYLVMLQRKFGEKGGVVMDGRDIGTIVFPNAEVKIFLTAEAKVRAERRFLELKAEKSETSLEEVIKNINERDFLDINRSISPLSKPEDANVIDNTYINPKETFELASKIIQDKIDALNQV